MDNPWDALLARCAQLTVDQERNRTSNYFEAVIFNQDIPQWVEGLGQHLGPAVKPAGESPSRLAKQLTETFGGIRREQILFHAVREERTITAMFWPWSDQKHTTLKIWMTLPETKTS